MSKQNTQIDVTEYINKELTNLIYSLRNDEDIKPEMSKFAIYNVEIKTPDNVDSDAVSYYKIKTTIHIGGAIFYNEFSVLNNHRLFDFISAKITSIEANLIGKIKRLQSQIHLAVVYSTNMVTDLVNHTSVITNLIKTDLVGVIYDKKCNSLSFTLVYENNKFIIIQPIFEDEKLTISVNPFEFGDTIFPSRNYVITPEFDIFDLINAMHIDSK